MGLLATTKGTLLGSSESTRLGALTADPIDEPSVLPRWFVMVWLDETRQTYHDAGSGGGGFSQGQLNWIEDLALANSRYEELRQEWGAHRTLPVTVVLWHVNTWVKLQSNPDIWSLQWMPTGWGHENDPTSPYHGLFRGTTIFINRDDPDIGPPGHERLDLMELINAWRMYIPPSTWSYMHTTLDASPSMDRDAAAGNSAIQPHYHQFLAYLQDRRPDAEIVHPVLTDERWLQWVAEGFRLIKLHIMQP